MSTVKPKRGGASSIVLPGHITELIQILGDNALLLACKPRSKAPAHPKWGSLTIDAMRDSAYVRKLIVGNVGAALGITSAGLVSIDIDDDDAVQPFLARNPALLATFQTKGRRGCNFWLQMMGLYPPTTKLKLNGKAWGEFRSHGSQTIVWGVHPEGMRYQWLTRHPALAITFESIVWPDGLEGFNKAPKPYFLKEAAHCTDGTDGTEGIDGIEVVSSSVVCPLPPSSSLTLEYLISVATPTEVHQTHSALFTLARGVKTLELQESAGPFPIERLQAICSLWFKKTPNPFLSHSFEDYFMEFLSCYKDVRFPMGTGDTLKEALERARANPNPPPECALVSDPQKKLLIGLCYELQRQAGNEPFFVSARDCEKLLGQPWRTCAYWLNGFVVLGILQIVEKADKKRRRSTRFRYITRPASAPDAPQTIL
jgi:hypothetical protein